MRRRCAPHCRSLRPPADGVSLIGCTESERPLPDGRAEDAVGSEVRATVSADWAVRAVGVAAPAPDGRWAALWWCAAPSGSGSGGGTSGAH